VKKTFAALAAAAAALLLLAGAALAAPNVEIKIKAEKEKVVTKDGKKVTKLVTARETLPGDVIHYTILYRNTGNEEATNAVISDPIPEGTVYVPGSASENGDLTFSIDKGKTFKKQALLTYDVTLPSGKAEKRVASPEEYTHVRWVVKSIPAGAKGQVSFKVKVK